MVLNGECEDVLQTFPQNCFPNFGDLQADVVKRWGDDIKTF